MEESSTLITAQNCFTRELWKESRLPVWVLMCLLSNDGLSNALLQTLQGSNVRSRGRARGVGMTGFSGKSPCELAAELSPLTDFLSSSAEGGEPLNARDNSDIDRSRGESGKAKNKQKLQLWSL